MSLNLFSARNLRPEVELIRPCADIIVMFETDSIEHTPSSLERYLVCIYFQEYDALMANKDLA